MRKHKKSKKLLKYRWAVWGVLILAYVIVFFHRLALGVVSEQLIDDFKISRTTFANLGSMYFYAYMIMQIPAGLLADSIGARKTVAYGTLLAAVGSIIFGWAESIAIAFVARFFVGIGVSFAFICILKVQSQWFFEREFATMAGLTGFVGNLGGVLSQTPLALIVGYLTWRTTFVYIGFGSLFIALLCYGIVRNTPTEVGLPRIEEMDVDRKGCKPLEQPPLRKALMEVLKNKHIWPPFFLFVGVHGAYISLTGTWGIRYLVDVYGLSPQSAANYTSISVFGLSIGCLVIGKVSDFVEKRRLPTVMFTGIAVISWAALVFINKGKPPQIMLYLIFFLIGFSCAAFVTCWACGKEICHPTITGIATSVVNTGGFLGAALLPPILGKVFDNYSGSNLDANLIYQRAFIYCLGFALMSFVISLFMKETHCKNIYSQLINDPKG